jgi:hypothetical protein
MCIFNSFPPYFHSSVGKLSSPQPLLDKLDKENNQRIREKTGAQDIVK